MRKGVICYNPLLPGHLRDLYALFGRVIGVVFESWREDKDPEIFQRILDAICGGSGMSFGIRFLSEEDPEGSLWEIRREFDLSFRNCCLFTSDERMEALARNVKMGIVDQLPQVLAQ
jgi:hypothetical protein